LARAFCSKQINLLFLEAAANLEQTVAKKAEATKEDLTHPLCFHWVHHPNNISRQAIQQAYSDACAVTLKAAPTKDNRPLNITRMIVLYSRPKNLSDYLCRTVLKEKPGNRKSYQKTRVDTLIQTPTRVSKYGRPIKFWIAAAGPPHPEFLNIF